jgi:hypothetical protein
MLADSEIMSFVGREVRVLERRIAEPDQRARAAALIGGEPYRERPVTSQ